MTQTEVGGRFFGSLQLFGEAVEDFNRWAGVAVELQAGSPTSTLVLSDSFINCTAVSQSLLQSPNNNGATDSFSLFALDTFPKIILALVELVAEVAAVAIREKKSSSSHAMGEPPRLTGMFLVVLGSRSHTRRYSTSYLLGTRSPILGKIRIFRIRRDPLQSRLCRNSSANSDHRDSTPLRSLQCIRNNIH